MDYFDGKRTENKVNDNGNPLISIIVPVYQVYPYLNGCMESLMHQTYTNLEIILVDDGSTDGSEVLCDEYMRKDSRVYVIHQNNKGLSSARNIGLEYAKGEYIAFVDSDDCVVPIYIEELYRLIKKYNVDISMCAYKKYVVHDERLGNPENMDYISKGIKEICMSSEQMLRKWHGRYKKYETVIWNKLYQRNVLYCDNNINTIYFSEGRIYEDILVSHLIIQNAKKVALTTRCLYLYHIRKGSITNSIYTKENMEKNLNAQKERLRFFGKKHYLRACINLYIGYISHCIWFGMLRVYGLLMRNLNIEALYKRI